MLENEGCAESPRNVARQARLKKTFLKLEKNWFVMYLIGLLCISNPDLTIHPSLIDEIDCSITVTSTLPKRPQIGGGGRGVGPLICPM